MPPWKCSSPPTPAAPKPAPWKESQKEMVLNRPVTWRASVSAISMASDPPGQNRLRQRPSGVTSASFRAS